MIVQFIPCPKCGSCWVEMFGGPDEEGGCWLKCKHCGKNSSLDEKEVTNETPSSVTEGKKKIDPTL